VDRVPTLVGGVPTVVRRVPTVVRRLSTLRHHVPTLADTRNTAVETVPTAADGLYTGSDPRLHKNRSRMPAGRCQIPVRRSPGAFTVFPKSRLTRQPAPRSISRANGHCHSRCPSPSPAAHAPVLSSPSLRSQSPAIPPTDDQGRQRVRESRSERQRTPSRKPENKAAPEPPNPHHASSLVFYFPAWSAHRPTSPFCPL